MPPSETAEKELSFSEQRALIVGKNYERYEKKFYKFDEKNGFAATWHWPCFLFGGWWFLYRRMYWWFLFDILFSLIPYANIAWWVSKGLLGNYLYWKHLQNKVPKMQKEYLVVSKGKMEPVTYRSYLFAKGGPNNVAWVIVPFIFIAIIGILAVIAIPNFLKYQAKSRQSEAKINLKGLFTSEAAYFSERGSYADRFTDIGWEPTAGPKGKNSYTFYLTPNEKLPVGSQQLLPSETVPFVENDKYLAVAVGNIDSDPTLDVWAINQDGNLQNLINDVSN